MFDSQEYKSNSCEDIRANDESKRNIFAFFYFMFWDLKKGRKKKKKKKKRKNKK